MSALIGKSANYIRVVKSGGAINTTLYKTIYIDPPWPERGAGKCKRGADRHYKLMEIQEIRNYLLTNLWGKIAPNCHLYLWVTNNHLRDGLDLLDSLGFIYKTNIVWVKDRFGLGQYFRGQHEICLFGVLGKMPALSRKESTVLLWKRAEHSAKPKAMYSKIEKISPPPRIEIFSRHRRQGWDVLGNEAPKEEQTILKTGVL